MNQINRRSGIDRRYGIERRRVHDLAYFRRGGTERRSGIERRETTELRTDWVRVNRWSSVKKVVVLDPAEVFPLP